jgi:hypothetical protein
MPPVHRRSPHGAGCTVGSKIRRQCVRQMRSLASPRHKTHPSLRNSPVGCGGYSLATPRWQRGGLRFEWPPCTGAPSATTSAASPPLVPVSTTSRNKEHETRPHEGSCAGMDGAAARRAVIGEEVVDLRGPIGATVGFLEKTYLLGRGELPLSTSSLASSGSAVSRGGWKHCVRADVRCAPALCSKHCNLVLAPHP